MWHKNKAGNFGGVYMKIRFVFCALLTVGFVLMLSSCLSPLSEGSATVTIGGVSGRTVVPTAAELAGMTYELTLIGGSLGTFGGTYSYGDTVSVPPGSYRILVTARNADNRIRGVLEETRTLTEGSNQSLTLKSAIGIRSSGDLSNAINNSGVFYGLADVDNLLVIENDFPLTNNASSAPANAVTIIAEPGTTRTIRRGGSYNFTISGGNLTLGRPGESGTLIFDGENLVGTNAMFALNTATLTINGNTTITNCYDRGGIGVTGGTLNLNSGKIINNHMEMSSSVALGGGIYIENSILNFGAGPLEISGNTVTTTGSYDASGGGIYVGTGGTVYFTAPVCNLRIINNQAVGGAAAKGGGIHIGTSINVTFPPGVVISGNSVSGDTTTSGGGGIYKYSGATVNATAVNFGNGNGVNSVPQHGNHATNASLSFNYNW
jgi:hypothetical protein